VAKNSPSDDPFSASKKFRRGGKEEARAEGSIVEKEHP